MLMLVALVAVVVGLIIWWLKSINTHDPWPRGRMSERWLAELRASSRR